MLDRRQLLRGALWVAAAPIIVKAANIMPVRVLKEEPMDWVLMDWPYYDIGKVRGMLLPGLRHLEGYSSIPSQWTEVFDV